MSGELSPPIDLGSPLQRRRTSGDKPKTRWAGRATFVLVVLVGVTLTSRTLLNQAAPPPVAPAPPPAPEVTVSLPLKQKIASWTSFTGQFSAVDRVELRAQVSGYLTEIHFTDGQIVQQGRPAVPSSIRAPTRSRCSRRARSLQTAQAALDLANQQLARTTELKRSSFASIEMLDQRVQAQRGAQAALEQAKAASARRSSTSTSPASPPRIAGASARIACRSAT